MTNVKSGEPLVNNFKIPNWASKPPPGLHLDVIKDGKLVQVPLDSELHFGASTRMYVVRERPNPLYNGGPAGEAGGGLTSNPDGTNPMGPENRPAGLGGGSLEDDGQTNSLGLLYSQLPQSEVELENLTEFNTAHNRRITSMVDVASNPSLLRLGKRKMLNSVHFSEADEVINPEDVDPSVGRFRNLVQETFIPNKRSKDSHEGAFLGVAAPDEPGHATVRSISHRSSLNGPSVTNSHSSSLMPAGTLFGPTFSLANKLGLPVPNLAPDIDSDYQEPTLPPTLAILHAHAHSRPGSLIASLADGKQIANRLSAADILGTTNDSLGASGHGGSANATSHEISATGMDSGLVESDYPRRKKYAKEAWPGKRPGLLIGPVV